MKQIEWQGLHLMVGDQGQIESLATDANELLGNVRIEMPGWHQDPAEVLDEEITITWRHDQGASATLRQVFEQTWSLRLTVLNHSNTPLQVAAPVLWFSAPWPVRRWLAGAEAMLVVDAREPCGRQLVLTQNRGGATTDAGRTLLSAPELLVPAATDDGPGQYLIAWKGAWLADQRQVASLLPTWWPPTDSLSTGDVLELQAPDAAVELTGADVIETLEGTEVSLERPGRHLLRVHNRLGTAQVELFVADPVEKVLVTRARAILAEADPRTCSAALGWIVAMACDTQVLDEQTAGAFLASLVEARLAAPGPSEPFSVMVAAHEVARATTDDQDWLWEALVELAGRLGQDSPIGVGAQLALVHARLAAITIGRTDRRLWRAMTGPQPGSQVERALCAAEAVLLNRDPQLDEALWQLAGLLGAGLPGATVGLVRLAQCCMVTGMFPDHWTLLERWPHPLAQARERALRMVLAGLDHPDFDEALAWVLAGR